MLTLTPPETNSDKYRGVLMTRIIHTNGYLEEDGHIMRDSIIIGECRYEIGEDIISSNWIIRIEYVYNPLSQRPQYKTFITEELAYSYIKEVKTKLLLES